jgi:hypothetical protein
MKKTLLPIVFAVVLCLLLAAVPIGGTFALLMAESGSVTNTITIEGGGGGGRR